jgi:hypothetical protein
MKKVFCDICTQEIMPNDKQYNVSITVQKEALAGDHQFAMKTKECCPACYVRVIDAIQRLENFEE